MREHRSTLLLTTPTFLFSFMRRARREDFASLRLIVTGAEKLKARVADAFEEKYGCKSYTNYIDILHKVDAISIVTPTTSHYKIALDCLRAGKDILIEKPITESVEEADELITESERRGCMLQGGHLERYNPAVLAASEMVKEPVFIESERLSPFLGRGTDVDVTLDLMIHDVDIMLSLISSPVKEIRAVGAKVLTNKIDVAKAWLAFQNGCIALATVSRLSPNKQRILKVFQKNSYIYIGAGAHLARRGRGGCRSGRG